MNNNNLVGMAKNAAEALEGAILKYQDALNNRRIGNADAGDTAIGDALEKAMHAIEWCLKWHLESIGRYKGNYPAFEKIIDDAGAYARPPISTATISDLQHLRKHLRNPITHEGAIPRQTDTYKAIEHAIQILKTYCNYTVINGLASHDDPKTNYCEQFINTFSQVKIRGEGKRLSLEAVYVENSPAGLNLQHIPTHVIIVLVGPQGIGKSTFIKHLGITHAKEYLASSCETLLPILVKLPEYSNELKNRRLLSLEQYIRQVASDFIHDALSLGECLILLDSYDEILNERERNLIAEHIEAFADKWVPKGNRIILASREMAFRQTSLISTEQYAIMKCHLSALEEDEQRRQFLMKWCLALTPNANVDIQVTRIMSAIHNTPGVSKLAENPLMLRWMAILAKNPEIPLPANRTELYKRSAEFLLQGWPAEDKPSVGDEIDADVAELILSHLTWKAKRGEVTTKEVCLRFIQSKMSPTSSSFQAIEDSKKKLAQLFRSGLISDNNGRCQIEPPFDDYYAAQWLIADDNQTVRRLIGVKHRSGWKEVISMALEILLQKQASSFISTFQLAIYPAQADKYENILHRDLLLAGESLTRVERIETRLANQVLEDLFGLWISNSGAYQFAPLRVNIEGIFSGLQLEYAMNLFDWVIRQLGRLSGDKLAAAISALHHLKPSLTQTQIDDVSSLLNRYMTDGDDKVRAATIDILVVFDRLALSVEERLSLMQTSSSEEIRSATIRSCTYLDPIDHRLVNRLFVSLNDEGAIGKIAASTLVELAGRDKYIADQIKQQLASTRSPMVQQGLLTALNITPHALHEEFFPRILSLARKSQNVDVCWKALRLLGTYFSERQETMQILRSCLQEKSSSSWRRVRIECVRQLRAHC